MTDFIIVNKETKKKWKASSGKTVWQSIGAAKKAWNHHWSYKRAHEDAYGNEIYLAGYNVGMLASVYHLINAKERREGQDLSCRFTAQEDYTIIEVKDERIIELELTIQSMEVMIKSERWKELKEFVGGVK